MRENLQKILKNVFSVDTAAGYRLRYHMTRALACKDYAHEIGGFNLEATTLMSLFVWERTVEGHTYWTNIRVLTGGLGLKYP